MRRRKIFPYANISPLWTLTFLVCIIVQQIFMGATLCLFCFKFLNREWIDYFYLINTLFIHYVLIWNILGRLFYVSKCMNFSYSFLTKKVYPNYRQYDNDLDLKNQMFTEKRTKYMSKMIFFPLFGLFFLLLTLSIIPQTRCYLYALNGISNSVNLDCLDIIDQFSYDTMTIADAFLDILEIALLLTLLLKVYLFPLKRDQFKLRMELTSLAAIWVVFHHCYHTLIIMGFIDLDYLVNYLLNIAEHLCYILLFIFITYQRTRINLNQFHSMLYNYDIFMQNPICFNFLKNYIKSVAEEEYCGLFFYIDYNFFKKFFKGGGSRDSNYANNLENANLIYSEYFGERNIILTSNTLRTANSPQASHIRNFYIDFPIDITEKIEEFANLDFDVGSETLFEVFDEAYGYVNNKLYNRYLMMFRDEEEYKKLEKLICYFDFDFITNHGLIGDISNMNNMQSNHTNTNH